MATVPPGRNAIVAAAFAGLRREQHAEKKASDLSNLQIVKKIGRQLEPFIELEKKFNQCVEGPNTSKEEARILFSYLLGKNREKGKPREWEQLSRRRHK